MAEFSDKKLFHTLIREDVEVFNEMAKKKEGFKPQKRMTFAEARKMHDGDEGELIKSNRA